MGNMKLRFVRNSRCVKRILRLNRHTVVVACVLSHLHDAGTSINGPGVESGTADSGWQAESRGTTQHTTAALQKWERTRYSAESRDDVSLFEESLGCPATRICPRLVDPDGTYVCTAVLLFFCSFVLPGFTHIHTLEMDLNRARF